ncbi:MAG: ABC transporter ATP-binding protein [Chitinophagales bacterium]|nr:ABC transporter ATP-binding protein [Chitinophagales bacterium]
MLTANNIHKSYGDLQVLNGVSLEIRKSEIVSIVGSSGAGKSTLLHILGTLEHADKGNLAISDTEVSKLNDRQISKFRNEKIGFVFQFHHLLPEFTAVENVCIPAFIKKNNKSESVSKAEYLLKELGLQDRLHHKPSELSGGEQQRVAVARALINEPAIIMADEPSGNLDSENSQQLHQLFIELRNKFKQTFIIVTHNKDLAEIADRKLIMSDGQIIN